MARVSLIVPVYNVERFLSECLESIIAQTFEDMEIICVNDGSTDSSDEILREYADRDRRITVLEQENRGLSGARNRGLDVATGEYLLFLDSDDYFEPSMVADAYAQCVRDDADIGVFKIRYVYDDTGDSIVGDWSLRMELVPDHLPFSREDMTGSIFRFVTPSVWNKMMRRSFVQEQGLRFSTQLRRAEDLPFTFLALATARRITVIDKALVNYRKSLAGTMQSTIHQAPLEICKALAKLKHDLAAAGVFDEVERDFVNVALYQCLFTLETIGTPEAFRQLYEALKATYLVDLGIAGHSPDYFYDEHQYERFLRITRLSWTEYLFEEAGPLRESLTDRRARLRTSRLRLLKTKGQLDKIRAWRSYRLLRRIASIPRRIRRLSPSSRKVD